MEKYWFCVKQIYMAAAITIYSPGGDSSAQKIVSLKNLILHYLNLTISSYHLMDMK